MTFFYKIFLRKLQTSVKGPEQSGHSLGLINITLNGHTSKFLDMMNFFLQHRKSFLFCMFLVLAVFIDPLRENIKLRAGLTRTFTVI